MHTQHGIVGLLEGSGGFLIWALHAYLHHLVTAAVPGVPGNDAVLN